MYVLYSINHINLYFILGETASDSVTGLHEQACSVCWNFLVFSDVPAMYGMTMLLCCLFHLSGLFFPYSFSKSLNHFKTGIY